jgi:uncharacterized membrane-anchored protein
LLYEETHDLEPSSHFSNLSLRDWSEQGYLNVTSLLDLPLRSHPKRDSLHHEIHARPPATLTAPLAIVHLAMTADQGERLASRKHLLRLVIEMGLPLPEDDVIHFRADWGAARLRWELHTEFVTWTFFCVDEDGASDPLKTVPASWLAQVPGQVLVAKRLWVAKGAPEPARHSILAKLRGANLVGSLLSNGQAAAFTDFAIHADGMSRMVLLVEDLSASQVGRTVQRLLEVETYRMAGLLGLPAARDSAALLAHAERDLAFLATAICKAGLQEEPMLLDQLTKLASKVERQHANTQSRLTASAAYFELVDRRLKDLSEQPLTGMQTLGEFIDRRLSPARSTCASASQRQIAISERVSRISSLLSTRVGIRQQQSSEASLVALNRRQQMQIHLQATVEGLSVAAITYYVAGLVGYLAKASAGFTNSISPELASALSIPFAAFAAWTTARRLRRAAANDR